MRHWCSVVPLYNFRSDIREAIEFSHGLSLSPMPEWVAKDSMTQRLGERDRHWLSVARIAFIIKYQAGALGEPDPEWTGSRPHSIQDRARDLAVLANFALWLARPSTVGFDLAFHAPLFDDGWDVQRIETGIPILLCHPQDVDNDLTIEDIRRASTLHACLAELPLESALWTATRASWAALQMNIEPIRHLLFWIALEAVFGPEDAREMTFRLAQRIALFLRADRAAAIGLFAEAKKAYGFRSKAAHGRWSEDPKGLEFVALVEGLVRESFTRILGDSALLERLCGKDREEYLDSLAFS